MRDPEFEIVLASGNAGKRREFMDLLRGLPLVIEGLDGYPALGAIAETGTTFEENAVIKALTTARHTGKWAIADDSGLEVDALNGAPGVHSARYAGADATDAENRRRLLRALAGFPPDKRRARFVACLALAAPGGRTWTWRGILEGSITFEERGTAGFGYDPLFIPEGDSRTLAELGPEEKNAISHRGRAVAAMRPHLLEILAEHGPPVG